MAEHDRISPPMVTRAGPHINSLRQTAREMELGSRAIPSFVLALTAEDAMYTNVFVPQFAFGAVENNFVSFPGTVGTQGVVEKHLVGIANLDLHRVFDADIIGEYASVPNVTILDFYLEV